MEQLQAPSLIFIILSLCLAEVVRQGRCQVLMTVRVWAREVTSTFLFASKKPVQPRTVSIALLFILKELIYALTLAIDYFLILLEL